MSEYILEMVHITKEFPGVKALDDVTFKVKKGEIHALVGENGAGKSTLMKILSGVYPYGTYSGDIFIEGKKQHFRNIKDSEHAGVAIIYQELTLVKGMTVGENIFLGREPVVNGIINWNKVYADSKKLFEKLNIEIDVYEKVENLGIGQQQMVEIAKAISKDSKILILDEPTAALTESETRQLFRILKDLKNHGVTCIYISHRLEEIFEIADTVTVLRDGKTISTDPISNLTEDEIIKRMVGRELTQRYPKVPHKAKRTIMEVRNFSVYDKDNPEKKIIDNVSFEIKEGEILGISGLMGAGRTELFMSIFGAYPGRKEGEIWLEGKKISINNPREAIEHGICYLSEDRKRYGLVLMMDIKDNILLPNYQKFANGGIINIPKSLSTALDYVGKLRIKIASPFQQVMNLSGGNQQKVIIAKWLLANPKILILDEPTRGIDVGAKYEIYNLMNQFVDQGVGIVMISSELPEILGMSDRILVMQKGKIAGELMAEDATQEKIMTLATGGR
ncbi:xylose ABC transporter ATP-binding protein [Caldicellulosiruptor bescii]|uniref:ABC transporter related n=2 Tax=Caldicellulosiruptor bescii TaxID=31899 RepID=B9MLQ6_CALBD|nr:xylose ABC transporter ATP-binding protein [Caldicellulosiruptor bescii]ACM59264.1 ABC transporter related [Caldicellulosiruptor bescii DSM 6725]PBC88279.1 xylose ABC transporter ATP-binding protein [Caldicellulosiruptor bescii]PBC92240.1 xylose ABC transporter ATP-binding protein [Caldicellulosiruptor bescii]PBD04951.1 xylose ABC transporter ATP-binding protein [Caldicellulosiruptor bescii]PBD05419.1 xylose ABC transporter ATP-binding protein [Caldicellulosiruptor bescii]